MERQARDILRVAHRPLALPVSRKARSRLRGGTMTTGRPVGRPRRHDTASDTLRHEIAAGRFRDADLLPGERELATQLDISRSTLRRAIATLVEEGRLVQRQGLGTAIARAAAHPARIPLDVPPSEPPTNAAERSAFGLRTLGDGARIVQVGVRQATPEEVMMLGTPASARLFYQTRVLLAGQFALAVEHALVPSRFIPDGPADAVGLLAALADAGHAPARTIERLRGVHLGEADAALLGAAASCPALLVESVVHLADGSRGALTRTLHRADRLDAIVEHALKDP